MKKALVCALLGIGLSQAGAQVTVTNLVQDLTIKLTGYYQSGVEQEDNLLRRSSSSASINNKSVITVLGTQLGQSFSSKAKLLLISPVVTLETLPAALQVRVVIRDKANGSSYDTDVTPYFGLSILQSVESTKTRINPYAVSGTGYDVSELRMTVEGATFAVQGFAKTSINEVDYAHNPVGRYRAGTFNVSGYGTYGAGEGVGLTLMGTVKLSGKNSEVVTVQ